MHVGYKLWLSSAAPIPTELTLYLGARRNVYSQCSSGSLSALLLAISAQDQKYKALFCVVNPVPQPGMSKFHHTSVIQINGTQSGTLARHRASVFSLSFSQSADSSGHTCRDTGFQRLAWGWPASQPSTVGTRLVKDAHCSRRNLQRDT